MIFKRPLAEAVRDGRKTVTRRAISDNPRSPYHPDQAPSMEGKRIAIQPGRGVTRIATARVAGITRERFAPLNITQEEARREGFADRADFLKTWRELHGIVFRLHVWRIELADVEAVDA